MVKRVVWIERQSKGVTGERRCRGPVIPEEIDSTAGLVPGPGSAGLYALGRLGGTEAAAIRRSYHHVPYAVHIGGSS